MNEAASQLWRPLKAPSLAEFEVMAIEAFRQAPERLDRQRLELCERRCRGAAPIERIVSVHQTHLAKYVR